MKNDDISGYNNLQTGTTAQICRLLMDAINHGLPGATSKMYHGSPVWFVDDNPILGYEANKAGVNLLFWSGQSFDEPKLAPQGKFKAAGITFTSADEIDAELLSTWLEKSKSIVWDYKNIRQNKGQLSLITQ